MNGAVSKTVDLKRSQGSNPCLSAKMKGSSFELTFVLVEGMVRTLIVKRVRSDQIGSPII